MAMMRPTATALGRQLKEELIPSWFARRVNDPGYGGFAAMAVEQRQDRDELPPTSRQLRRPTSEKILLEGCAAAKVADEISP
ncbi:hypothetical protein PIB30_092399 [Stylosanthes scabra]|uniref:Uncharacterized protein n=1 Tax=Stylosanthes scabra TaxID=79078 RepID=A0ABU6RUS9_9FABA|nr:hypothetical protein [Stylosanthes scabra]